MKIRFEENRAIPERPCVTFAANSSDQAREVMDYLEQFSDSESSSDPYQTDDHLIMVKIDMASAEIDKNQLTIYTTDKTFIVRDTFDKFSTSD